MVAVVRLRDLYPGCGYPLKTSEHCLEGVFLDRLHQMRIASRLVRPNFVLPLRVLRHGDEVKLILGALAPQAPCYFIPGNIRLSQVEQHNVGPQFARALHGLPSALCCSYLMSPAGKKGSESRCGV